MNGREALARVREVMGDDKMEEYMENELSELFDRILGLIKHYEDEGEKFTEEGHATCIAVLTGVLRGIEADGTVDEEDRQLFKKPEDEEQDEECEEGIDLSFGKPKLVTDDDDSDGIH